MKEQVAAFIRDCATSEPTDIEFYALRSALLRWQTRHIPLYGRFVGPLLPGATHAVYPIPTPLFARFEFCAGEHSVQFRTSGTTTGIRGKHTMPDADVYELAVRTGVARLPFKIPLENTLSLCPSAAEFPDSSLGHMIHALLFKNGWCARGGLLADPCLHKISRLFGKHGPCPGGFAGAGKSGLPS
jgi:hypothetical protein